MTTERQQLFTRMATPLFQVKQSVADLFFKNRLSEEIEHAIDKHIQYLTRPVEEFRLEYIRALKNLDKVLQEIIYLEKGEAVLLAVAREQVLRYLFGFLQEHRTEKQNPVQPLIPGAPVIQKFHRNKRRLSKTQEKILEFVRREPDCRTKDVINQFSALSQRTVKRNLKELNEEGVIIKRVDGAAAYYSIA